MIGIRKLYPPASVRLSFDAGMPEWLTHFIRERVPDLYRIVQTDVTKQRLEPKASSFPDSTSRVVVNLSALNAYRYVNKYLEAANAQLSTGEYLVGCVETAEQRQQRLLTGKHGPFRSLFFFFDYLIMRVWPKLPYLKHLYFGLTRGRYRVLSEMEVYGRLYSCGFSLVDVRRVQGLTFFLARREGDPDLNEQASYGPLITLPRCGKNGRRIKVYKLRTMAPYSEYIQEFVYQRYGLDDGGKIKDDPRISPVGRILRRYWIDEFPMLINLLKGDLKLFGVRPLSAHYLSLYDEDFRHYRQRFKPGLIPPCYVDLPQTMEEIIASEERYLRAYERRPLQTDLKYFGRFLRNVLVKKVRSQ